MKQFIARPIDLNEIKKNIKIFRITAILGPRQSGKTWLAKQITYDHYFDLENPRDLASLAQPQLILENLKGLIVIDEIQRMPNLFPLLRYLTDNNPKQKYLILGSASKELIKQSSESLAGRIGYYSLGGLRLSDTDNNINKLWLRGGLPLSYTAKSDKDSYLWRSNYIATFLEKDVSQLGISIAAHTLFKFWTMLSHYHGQILNYSELGASFGISDMTSRRYVDILIGTFMVRLLQPWHNNTSKRLVKQPKLYLRDSGIFHSLASIEDSKQLLSHNKLGASWEGFALEEVAKVLNKRAEELYFWSTHTGAEINLFWQYGGKNWGIEFKYVDAPVLTKSMHIALNDLALSHLWVIYPGKKSYKLNPKVTALALIDVGKNWIYI